MVVRYALTPELDTCVIAFADEASFEVQLEVSVGLLSNQKFIVGHLFPACRRRWRRLRCGSSQLPSSPLGSWLFRYV